MSEYGLMYVEALLAFWLVLRALRRRTRWARRLRERRVYQRWQLWQLRPRYRQEVGS